MFANSKKVTTFAPEIEREILDKKDGPFVYRLGRKIFILERGVRFPHGLPNKKAIDKSMAFLFGSPALCRVSGAQFENGSVRNIRQRDRSNLFIDSAPFYVRIP